MQFLRKLVKSPSLENPRPTTSEISTISADEEIRCVPSSWVTQTHNNCSRILFHPKDDKLGPALATYTHPLLGNLPDAWELHKRGDGKFIYLNTSTLEEVTRGPRKAPSRRTRGPTKSISPDEIAAKPATSIPPPPPGSVRVRRTGMGKIIRLPILDKPLDNVYETFRVIDDGQGVLGGMNSGVYVVRKRDTGQLFVQKRYVTCDKNLAKLFREEINLMRDLIHSSIVQYVDAYVIAGTPFVAAVYMEFCDRGTLADVLGRYKKKKKQWQADFVPESFVWHAFLGLADALHFLQTGQSCLSVSLQKNDARTWRPVLHRDIKPDNILLRSHETPGSAKPVYVLLSDFGIARREPAGPDAPPFAAVGTPEYHAPELCFDPYPAPSQIQSLHAPHSSKSDVWALACVVYCLCERDALAHLDRRCYPLRSARALGRRARRPVLDITDKAVYSEYLERSIVWAAEADPARRPDAVELIAGIKTQSELWVSDPNWAVQVAESLPEWAAPKSI